MKIRLRQAFLRTVTLEGVFRRFDDSRKGASLIRRWRFAFGQQDDAIDAGESDFFAVAAGPEDFEFVDSRGRAKAEVETRVRCGSVAAAAEDVGALADAADREEGFRADGIARALRATH